MGKKTKDRIRGQISCACLSETPDAQGGYGGSPGLFIDYNDALCYIELTRYI
jgi:hypothetical protein